METFFGGATTPSDASPAFQLPLQREIRRGVWSSTQEEENEWIDALLSMYARGRDRASDTSDAAFSDVSQKDIHTIKNTEIPKIIHFIWLGKNSIPTFRFLGVEPQEANGSNSSIDMKQKRNFQWNECMASWEKHHPPSRGWNIHLWTEQNVVDDDTLGTINIHYQKEERERSPPSFCLDIAKMHNVQEYQHAMKIQNYGMASDILRLEILNKYGGVYVDIDYWCVDSLDDTIADRTNKDDATRKTPSISPLTTAQSNPTQWSPTQFFCGASNTGCIELNNGLMACKQGGHPIIWKMIDSIHDNGILNRASEKSHAAPPRPREHDSIGSLLSSFLDSATANSLNTSQQCAKYQISPMEVIENTGPGLLTRSVCRWLLSKGEAHDDCASDKNHSDPINKKDATFSQNQVIVHPSHVFHPFPNHMRKELLSLGDSSVIENDINSIAKSHIDRRQINFLQTFVVSGKTKAIHLWGCSWQA